LRNSCEGMKEERARRQLAVDILDGGATFREEEPSLLLALLALLALLLAIIVPAGAAKDDGFERTERGRKNAAEEAMTMRRSGVHANDDGDGRLAAANNLINGPLGGMLALELRWGWTHKLLLC